MAKKKSVLDFYEMKKTGEKITFLTAYDFPTAQFAEAYGPDMLLVGDSLGICVYGYQGTIPVVMGHIGLTPQSSGQLLIVSDAIGQFQAFTPKFVKKYRNIAGMVTDAMKAYAADVREGAFPGDEHCYKMIEGEEEKFIKLIES